MKDTYRLHQAAFLMVDREPPPDELPKDAGTRQVGKITLITPKHFDLEPKACPYDVDRFLKGFLQIIIENRIPELGDKLHQQQISFQVKAPGKGYIRIKNSRELVHWLHHKVELFPLEPTNINDFFPIILEKSNLVEIAEKLNISPAFLKDQPAAEPTQTPEPAEKKPFSIPVPDGTAWGQITFRIVNDQRVEVTHPGGVAPWTMKALGLDKKPKLKALFELFAVSGGSVRVPEIIQKKENIRRLKDHIKSLFPNVKGEPIKNYQSKHGYVCAFHIVKVDTGTDDEKARESQREWKDIMGAKVVYDPEDDLDK